MATVAGRDADELFRALAIELDRADAQATEFCVIGGFALSLLGLVIRPTKDIDLVALAASKGPAIRIYKADPLPEHLYEAASAVARQFGIGTDWLNPGPANLIDRGLPVGFESRLVTLDYGRLQVHVAGRLDQVCFKTYAAADVAGRHLTDLLALQPTGSEIRVAFEWTLRQDPSEGFLTQLRELADYLEVRDVFDEVAR